MMTMLLHDLVLSHSRTRPRAVAVIEADRGGNSVTYRELAGRIDAIARELSGRGFKRGARVGILSKNSIGFVEAFFAVSFAGGVIVPLNYALNAHEIAGIARHAGISGLYAGSGLEEKGALVAKTVRSIRLISGTSGIVEGKRSPANIMENDLAAIIYTSGTTGGPLGVMLSHKNLISNARSIAGYAHLGAYDSVCCVLPFYYIYGLSLLLSHLLVGGTIVLDNRFMYPNTVLDSIERFKTTGFAGVSSHYTILLGKSDFKKRRLVSVRYFMQAGDRMPESTVKELHSAFPRKKIYLMYGQTEAAPRLAYLDPSFVNMKPGSIGKAIPGVRLKVVDEKGRECAVGEEGEITARGGNIMLGYWKDQKATKKVIRNGWLYTGDIGYKDKDGDLFLTGRKKDFVKVAGRKVNPCKVTDIILAHPGVMEAAVVGLPDPLTGIRIKAFVVPKKGIKITKGKIIDLCKSNLPSYGVPSDIVITFSLPRSALGKIDRERLVNLR